MTNEEVDNRRAAARNLLSERETEVRAKLEKIAPVNLQIKEIEKSIRAKVEQLLVQEEQATGLQVLYDESRRVNGELNNSALKLAFSNKDLRIWCVHPDWAAQHEGYYRRCLLCGMQFEND